MAKERFDSVKYRNAWKAQQRDRVELILPKGTKVLIQQRAAKLDKSVNGYIYNLIIQDLKRDSPNL